jgi:uncharacterized membrane protein YbhN (UPF0104 family)
MKLDRKLALVLINVLCIAAFCIWTYQNISLREIYGAFAAMPKAGLISVIVLNIFVMSFYGLRMSVLAGIRFVPAFLTIWLGFGFNGMLPMRLGDLAKILYARQLFGISTSRMTAITAIEKFFDLCAVLFLGIVATQFVSFNGIQTGIRVLALLLAVAFAALAVLAILQRRWHPANGGVFGWLNEVVQSALAQLNGKRIGVVSIYTVVIWCISVITAYVMFVSIYPAFNWTDAVLLTLILVLAVSVPGAPAGLGIVEAGIVGYLHTAFQANASQAIVAAFVFHLASSLPQILGAVAIMIFATLRKKQLKVVHLTKKQSL